MKWIYVYPTIVVTRANKFRKYLAWSSRACVGVCMWISIPKTRHWIQVGWARKKRPKARESERAKESTNNPHTTISYYCCWIFITFLFVCLCIARTVCMYVSSHFTSLATKLNTIKSLVFFSLLILWFVVVVVVVLLTYFDTYIYREWQIKCVFCAIKFVWVSYYFWSYFREFACYTLAFDWILFIYLF